jgi:hypothetical protein
MLPLERLAEDLEQQRKFVATRTPVYGRMLELLMSVVPLDRREALPAGQAFWIEIEVTPARTGGTVGRHHRARPRRGLPPRGVRRAPDGPHLSDEAVDAFKALLT